MFIRYTCLTSVIQLLLEMVLTIVDMAVLISSSKNNTIDHGAALLIRLFKTPNISHKK